ncbi:hypothetical protein [Mangrovimonas cancribranchiae]|uniref:Uncharacterized protein n=1 Tax=Mangrovimonas cancribranchiae TaxID=3080055 RepID=A0AAU6P5H1_9FLAO
MKKGLLITLASLGGLVWFYSSNTKKYLSVGENLDIKLKRLNDINYSNGVITANVNVAIVNNTNIETSITKLATLKKLVLISNASGAILAESYPNINGIVLNANGETLIQNIEITATTQAALSEFIKNQFKGDYKVKATVNAFGKDWVLG